MILELRSRWHAYTTRRSPWGPPWWLYGVAFGAANLVRHVVIAMTPAEIPEAIRIASWLATALVVIIVINGVAVALHRRGDGDRHGPTHPLTPTWPLRRRAQRRPEARSPAQPDQATVPTPTRGGAMMEPEPPEQDMTPPRWAPWWTYLVIILGANSVRRALVGDAGSPTLGVVVALAIAATLFTIITVVYRAMVRHDGTSVT